MAGTGTTKPHHPIYRKEHHREHATEPGAARTGTDAAGQQDHHHVHHQLAGETVMAWGTGKGGSSGGGSGSNDGGQGKHSGGKDPGTSKPSPDSQSGSSGGKHGKK